MKIVSSALIAMLVCIASLSCSAFADDTVPIFKGQDLTREKLLDVLAPELERGVSKNPAPGSGQTPSTRRIGLLITFVVSSAKLDGQAKASLDILADVLQTERLRNNTFVIEGHADPTGNPEHNWKLSQERAESVVKYLSTQGNVRRERLKAEGKGASDLYNAKIPTAPENRRVVVVAMP